MKKLGMAALVVALMLGMGAFAVPAAALAQPSDEQSWPGDRVTRRAYVEVFVALRYDPATRDVRVVAKRGRTKATGEVRRPIRVSTVTYPPVLQRAARASYTCLVRRDATRRLKPGEPLRTSVEGRSYSMKYLLFPYTLDNARRVAGRSKRQVELCVTGGGDVWNGYHQSLDGASMVYSSTVDRTIGTEWGTEVVNGKVSSTLSLKVGAGPVQIGASTTVSDQDRHTGSTGRSGDVGAWDAMEPYNVNRVNTFYKSGRTWRWQGSDDYQGNNGHLLVEMNQRGSGSVGYMFAAALRAHCSHPFGIGCGDLH